MDITKIITSIFLVITTFVSTQANNIFHFGKVISSPNSSDNIATSSAEIEIKKPREEKSASMSAKVQIRPNTVVSTDDSIVIIPQQNIQQTITSFESYKYPNSTITNFEGKTLSLESPDSPQTITEWYKAKINSMGVRTKSFVTTKANDKILNKLVGSDGFREISIEISQENSTSKVAIKITI